MEKSIMTSIFQDINIIIPIPKTTLAWPLPQHSANSLIMFYRAHAKISRPSIWIGNLQIGKRYKILCNLWVI